MIKVKDEPGLVRDPFSKAILRVDLESLHAHRRKNTMMHKLQTDANKVGVLEDLIKRQNSEIEAMKAMMHKLLDFQSTQSSNAIK